MARPVGEILKEIIDKLSNQMEEIRSHPGKLLSQYQEGLKDGLNRAIRTIEQTHTHE